jgi:hypothetical protein
VPGRQKDSATRPRSDIWWLLPYRTHAMRFSERHGYRPIRTAVQVDTADQPLRNALWNVIEEWILVPLRQDDWYNSHSHSRWAQFQAKLFWDSLNRQPFDRLPRSAGVFSEHVRKSEVLPPWSECSPIEERVRFVARRIEGEGTGNLCYEFGSSVPHGASAPHCYRHRHSSFDRATWNRPQRS